MGDRIDDARDTARAAEGSRRRGWRHAAGRGIVTLGLLAPLLGHAGACKIQTMELPVTMVGSRAVATVGINGTPVPLTVDSGAFFSILTDAAAQQLQLKVTGAPYGMTVRGLTGDVDARMTKVKQLTLLKGELANVEFLVGGNEPGAGTRGLLGRNILSFTDAEYDLAHGVIRFVVPGDECDDTNMAYWAGDLPVSEIKLQHEFRARVPAIRATATLNGRKISVLFDTRATSMVSLSAAKRVGIAPEAMKRAGRMYGAGTTDTAAWTASFDSFEIGGEKILNNRLLIADFDSEGVDMLLGVDFFLSHHLYVSNSQHRLYFTYNGGPVFPLNKVAPEEAAASEPEAAASAAEPAGADADAFARRGAASAARGDFVHALEDLDRACALDPTQASYFTRRGVVHGELRQLALALADFDEALRLDPAQAEARLDRAALRLASKERDGALQDLAALDTTLAPQDPARLRIAQTYDSLDMRDKALAQWNLWIPAHPNEIQLEVELYHRCWDRAMLGVDLDKALDDCDEAVDRQSKNASFLDGRGWVYLRLGKFKKAASDFDKSVEIRPLGAWSLYGRGFVRIRLGDKDAGQADLDAARKVLPTIDEKAGRYGLSAAQQIAP